MLVQKSEGNVRASVTHPTRKDLTLTIRRPDRLPSPVQARPGAMSKTLSALLQQQKTIVLDGAMGTEVERRGINLNGSRLWSAQLLIDRPDVIRDIHLAYLRSGSDVITTATYQASLDGFKSAGLDVSKAHECIISAVQLAAEAREQYLQQAALNPATTIRQRPLIGFSAGSYGACLCDGSEYNGNYASSMTVDQLMEWHLERLIPVMKNPQIDLFCFETVPCLLEVQAICRLLSTHPGLANACAWVSCSCRDNQHTSHGETFSQQVVPELWRCEQVVGIGINCTHPAHVPQLLSDAQAVLSQLEQQRRQQQAQQLLEQGKQLQQEGKQLQQQGRQLQQRGLQLEQEAGQLQLEGQQLLQQGRQLVQEGQQLQLDGQQLMLELEQLQPEVEQLTQKGEEDRNASQEGKKLEEMGKRVETSGQQQQQLAQELQQEGNQFQQQGLQLQQDGRQLQLDGEQLQQQGQRLQQAGENLLQAGADAAGIWDAVAEESTAIAASGKQMQALSMPDSEKWAAAKAAAVARQEQLRLVQEYRQLVRQGDEQQAELAGMELHELHLNQEPMDEQEPIPEDWRVEQQQELEQGLFELQDGNKWLPEQQQQQEQQEQEGLFEMSADPWPLERRGAWPGQQEEGAAVQSSAFNSTSNPNLTFSQMRRSAAPILLCYPNSGEAWDGEHRCWQEHSAPTAEPEEFASAAREWVAAGARAVGGCCRTGPEHIKALRRALVDSTS